MSLLDALLHGQAKVAPTAYAAPRKMSPVGYKDTGGGISQAELDQLHKNYQATQVNSRKGIVKYLPAIGATAAGLAAAPFTGGTSLAFTLAALGAAGAAGGAGGELLAQHSNHEGFNAGRVEKEALISGATSAIPIGGVGRAAKVASSGEHAAMQGSKGLRANLALHGQQMEARSGGYAVNAKIPGTNNLDVAGSSNINQILRSEKIGTGSPLSRLNKVESRLQVYGKNIDSTVAKNDVAVTKAQRQQIANEYLSGMKSKLGSNKSVMTHAQDLADNFVKNGGNKASEIIAKKRQLDSDLVNYIKNPDSALAQEQRAVVPFRESLKNATNKIVPGLESANNKYHDLSTAKGYLVKGAGEMNSRGGLVTRLAESGPIKTVESKIGRGAQRLAGAAPGGEPGMVRTGGTELAKQAVARPLAEIGLPGDAAPAQQDMGPQTAQDLAGAKAEEDLYASDALHGFDPNNPTQDSQDQAPSPYSLQQALQDIQRDPKHADTYLSIYKTVDAAGGTGGKKLGATQQQQASNAQTGLQSIQDLANMIQSNPSIVTKSGVPGQGSLLGGFESKALGTGEYNAAASNIRDVISRLRSGAALTVQEEKRYQNMLPKAGDTNSTISYKLTQLNGLFQKFANPSVTATEDSNLSSALLQAQGGF